MPSTLTLTGDPATDIRMLMEVLYNMPGQSGRTIPGLNLIFGIQTPAFSAAPAPDPTQGLIYFPAAMTGAVNVANPVNAVTKGQALLMIWQQDGAGGRVLTYSGTNWRSVGIAAQTTTLSTVTIDLAINQDGTIWRVMRLVTGQTV